MASFVIHNTAGERFLDILEKKYLITLTEKQRKQFLLGNLIVDSSRIKLEINDNLSSEELMEIKIKYGRDIQREKVLTHFRDFDDYDLCIQTPNLDKFVDKYNDIIKADFTAFGYLFHLYTDKMFFNNLFNKTFEFLDENYNKTIYNSKTRFVKIIKNNSICKYSDLRNGDNPKSMYHDYTVMNKILVEYYGTSFSEEEYMEFVPFFENPGIEEVDYQNIKDIIRNTASYIKESYLEEDSKLNIFDENKVINFIEEISEYFLNDYYDKLPINSYNVKKKIK